MFRVVDNTRTLRKVPVGYISIVGPKGERVCDFFPFAKNGIGKDFALQLAEVAAEAMTVAVEQGESA